MLDVCQRSEYAFGYISNDYIDRKAVDLTWESALKVRFRKCNFSQIQYSCIYPKGGHQFEIFHVEIISNILLVFPKIL